MQKKGIYKLGLASLAAGVLCIGSAVIQDSLSADTTTSMLGGGQGTGMLKAVFVGGGFLFVGGVGCFVYTSMWRR